MGKLQPPVPPSLLELVAAQQSAAAAAEDVGQDPQDGRHLLEDLEDKDSRGFMGGFIFAEGSDPFRDAVRDDLEGALDNCNNCALEADGGFLTATCAACLNRWEQGRFCREMGQGRKEHCERLGCHFADKTLDCTWKVKPPSGGRPVPQPIGVKPQPIGVKPPPPRVKLQPPVPQPQQDGRQLRGGN